MNSDNPSGADNQQETESSVLELDPHWIVGFVDGEGCFSVSFHCNPTYAKRTRGWQINPVFQVYQHEDYRVVLEGLAVAFGCGKIRPKGGSSKVLTYAVDRIIDIEERVIPFFETYEPRVKRDDFRRFAAIVRAIRAKEHFTPAGFERVVRLAYAMNQHGKQRKRSIEEILLGSSETARQVLERDAPLPFE